MNAAAIGKKIREARTIQRLTQKQVSDRIGIGRTCYIDLEKGRSFPKFDKMLAIAKILGVKLL